MRAIVAEREAHRKVRLVPSSTYQRPSVCSPITADYG